MRLFELSVVHPAELHSRLSITISRPESRATFND